MDTCSLAPSEWAVLREDPNVMSVSLLTLAVTHPHPDPPAGLFQPFHSPRLALESRSQQTVQARLCLPGPRLRHVSDSTGFFYYKVI